MGLSRSELIKKLEAISVLYDRALKIKSKMNNFKPDDNYKRKVNVPKFPGEYESDYDMQVREILEGKVDHTANDAVEYMSICYDKAYQPEQPAEPKTAKQPAKDTSRTDEYKKKMGCMPIVAGFVVICSLISGGLFSGETLTVVLNLVIIAVCGIVALAFFKKKRDFEKEDEAATKNAIKEYEQTKIELQEKHKKDMEAYQNDINSYKLQKADFLEKYVKWREAYLESLKEEAEIEELLEKDRQTAVEKINNEEFVPVLNDLAEINDLVTEEYLPALNVIIDLLRSGRADDLKEAINLYEDIVYRERQLQLEREKEDQRRREEELRRQDEERRYQEDKTFREQQERQRQYEEERRERESERRHQEEVKQREQQERNRKIAEDNATRRQCDTCALRGNCSMFYRRPNCASYRPR